ncbi:MULTISPECIES: NUDIX hydrolase [unclassified Fusibacter]|uniref:NUDIX hydrolase n=1 Tax=unclassified Fusibacter TaxID=2624464 RepID=UPI0010107373|nr:MULTISPECIES: NUDIX hydrolase [unclassified Fusibacter]MCK8060352.1 NUDIX domain-containing protein [Fusibacter sp. A2]NPE20359.1 NUDIX domain-containing protein [Fusibacter sp. A1]RXV63565.1 hypothetical protein DWB64_00905 [Fusibacter sp. A1]
MLKETHLNFTTVGVYLKYEDSLAFMIGPDQNGTKLKVIRLGGHIEKGESIQDALERELMEEACVTVDLKDVDYTFYKVKWHKKRIMYEKFDRFDLKPLIVVGNQHRATALFIAETLKKPVPAMESHGIIFLNRDQVRSICTKRITLADFIASGGEVIFQKPLNHEMQITAGVHLKFIYELILMNHNIINDLFK